MPYQHGIKHEEKPSLKFSPLLTAGGLGLAGMAGFINAASLSFFHIPISHMSGAVTHLGLDSAIFDLTAIIFSLLLIGSFVSGAVLSGAIIGAAKFIPGRRYGIAMMFEGILLSFVPFFIQSGRSFGLLIAAFTCGLQNGMASSYYGLIIRTTHMTGILTDIGVLIGHLIRHRRIELWKLTILTAICMGFFLGSVAGAIMVEKNGAFAFYIPAFLIFTTGLIYFGIIFYAKKNLQK